MAVAEELKREFVQQGALFSERGRDRRGDEGAGHAAAACRIRRSSAGRRPYIAEKAGIKVPSTTRVLVAPLAGVGRDYPLSIEKLCPVLSWYVVQDWRAGCERCKEILRYGGMGHTMSVHSRNDQIILEFGLKKPAYRIVVNTPTTHGSVGMTTGLDPAMTLGCGGWGGNITSDNISPKHLLNIKRVAYETQPAKGSFASAVSLPRARRQRIRPGRTPPPARRPQPGRAWAAHRSVPRLARYLDPGTMNPEPGTGAQTPNAEPEGLEQRPPNSCAKKTSARRLRAGLKIVLDSRTIVTPAARDLGEEKRVFVDAR